MIGLFSFSFLLFLILFIVGLFKPNIIPKNTSRKKSSLIFGLGTILFFILIGVTAPPSSTEITELITPTPTLEPTPTTETDKQTVKVARVIDGDTIEIEGGQKVRYIGINTPETVDPRKSVECFGQEASDKNKELVEGKEVELEKDVSETDKYGRLLRYIWLGDLLINEVLVREGYAQSSTYPPDIKYQERFKEAEKKAREEKKGLWGDVCMITPTPTQKIIPTPTPQSQTIQSTQPVLGSYICNCSKTCAQMSSCEEAYFQLNNCDCSRLDRDNDGVPCEDICPGG